MEMNERKPVLRFAGFAEDWEQRKVGDLGEVITGSTPSTSHEEYYSENGIPWVTPTDIDRNVIYDTPKKLSVEGQKVGRVVPQNSILVTCVASIGKNAMLGTTGSFNQQINGLVSDSEKYHPYFLFSESTIWSEMMKHQAAAATMQIVNKTEFSELVTMIPKLEEQQKIGNYFHHLDHLITLHQRKYDKLVKVKKSMLEKMFPQNGEKKPELRFAGYTDDWEQRKLGELVNVCSGKDYKYLDVGDVPVYGTGGYMLSVSDALSNDEDAIGIGRKGTIDKPFILRAPFWTVDTLFYCIPNKEYNFDFLYDIFQNINWKTMDESTGVPSLSKIAINDVDVLVPSLSEQTKIGEYFSILDHLITLHQRKLEKLKNIKKSMLEKMFV